MPKAHRLSSLSTRAGRLLGAAVLGGGSLLALLGGCRGSRGGADRPEATLAASADSQSSFRALRAAWFAGSGVERRKLEPELRSFLLRFPTDEQSDMVRVLIAFDCASRGALLDARVLLAQVREHNGSVHDFSRVAEAFTLLRDGKPEASWSVLDPLAGKIVDPDERLVYSEIRLRAATAAHRYAHALTAAEELLAEAPLEAQSSLQEVVRQQFQAASKAGLVESLQSLDHVEADEGAISQARAWLRRMLRERLVSIAVREKDASLARDLLDTAPAQLRASASGSALVDIAGGGQSVPLISGRSLGVALSLANSETRRRSASLAAGLARGLGSPSTMNDPGAVHLISQDDGGTGTGTVEALRELAAEGAALLVAGVDGSSADAAALFAEENAIAVILTQPPETVVGPFRHVFVLGESSSDEQAAIDAELSRRGLLRIGRVGRLGEACDVPTLNAGSSRFSVQQWRQDRVAALLILGPAACASDVVRELRAAAFMPELALGLEAADFVYASDAPPGRFALGAGSFPAAVRLDFADNPALPPLEWYEALGHDAAQLAKEALVGFPDRREDNGRVVRELHARAERALGTARATLWTSDERGFSEARVLRRTLTVVSPSTYARKKP
ncbi:MAG: hypothetical protein ABUL62_09720 [Myxococcales bacterium]